MGGEEQSFKGYAPLACELFESGGKLFVECPLFGGELARFFGGREVGILGKLGGPKLLELLFPEEFGVGVLDGLLFECHKIPVGESWSGWQDLLVLWVVGGVECEQFGEERGDGPSVEDGVVEGEGEVEGLLGELVCVDAEQGRLVPVEAVLFLLFGELVECLLPLRFVEVCEVVYEEWDGGLLLDELEGP